MESEIRASLFSSCRIKLISLSESSALAIRQDKPRWSIKNKRFTRSNATQVCCLFSSISPPQLVDFYFCKSETRSLCQRHSIVCCRHTDSVQVGTKEGEEDDVFGSLNVLLHFRWLRTIHFLASVSGHPLSLFLSGYLLFIGLKWWNIHSSAAGHSSRKISQPPLKPDGPVTLWNWIRKFQFFSRGINRFRGNKGLI